MYTMKGDKMAKRSSFGSMVRRRLSDITNSQPQPKSPSCPEKLLPDAASAKEYIDHLVKENMAMVKLIQDKNFTKPLSFMSPVQELNLGKERGQGEVNVQKTEIQEAVVSKESALNEDKSTRPCNDGRRRRLSRSRSLGSSAIPHQHAEKGGYSKQKVITNATQLYLRCLRRQSASSRIRQPEEPAENLFEIDDAKFPVVSPSAEGSLAEGSCVSELEAQARRTSISRPLRKAAEKVQSYKERPINVKMRRSE
ncbi:UNVERIFIED_CONTAM: hypothetical protein Scaly_0414000 [Sesamum calycinum]|uniref:Shugoshin C-terminal domain-containing protein n=1 Tax=Sesamum calycinum TaxID=2727403 RepID=A0AAW2SDQ9_9LAMI